MKSKIKLFRDLLQRIPLWFATVVISVMVVGYRAAKFHFLFERYGRHSGYGHSYIDRFTHGEDYIYILFFVFLFWLLRTLIETWSVPKSERVKAKAAKNSEQFSQDLYRVFVCAAVVGFGLLIFGKVLHWLFGPIVMVCFALFGRLNPGKGERNTDDRVSRCFFFGIMVLGVLKSLFIIVCESILGIKINTPEYSWYFYLHGWHIGNALSYIYIYGALAAYLLFYQPSPGTGWMRIMKVIGYAFLLFPMLVLCDLDDGINLIAFVAWAIGCLIVWFPNYVILRRMEKDEVQGNVIGKNKEGDNGKKEDATIMPE